MANRLQTARDFNPYAPGVTMEELQQIRRQLAKVMNQRMVRLENTKSPISGESYDFGAYDLMQDYLKGKGKKAISDTKGARFSEVIAPKDMSKSDLQREILKMQKFEQMPSSQISGMHKIEEARVKTFMTPDPKIKRKGLSEKTVRSKDFYDFLNSTTYAEIANSLSSEQIIEEYSRAYDRGLSAKQISEAFQTYMKRSRELTIKGMKRSIRRRKPKS